MFFFKPGLFFQTMVFLNPDDVTHFFTDPDENCTAYVYKIRNKRHFVHENYLIF